eukprot:s1527_g15.t1
MRLSVALACVSWKPLGKAAPRPTKALRTLTVCFNSGCEERSASFLGAVSSLQVPGYASGHTRDACGDDASSSRAASSRFKGADVQGREWLLSLTQALQVGLPCQTRLHVRVSVFHCTVALENLCYMGCS